MNELSPLIRFPVYEPAGHDVTLTEPDLLQHLLIIGATGSGKTSLLHRLMAQLIQHKHTGLLIFDAKQDDTVKRVRELAAACDRANDVVVLGPNGDHHLDLFAPLKSLADVDLMTRRLLAGSESMGKENAYWDETRAALIDAAMTLLTSSREPVTFGSAIRLMRQWFFGPLLGTTGFKQAVEEMTLGLEHADSAEELKISQTLDTISLWQTLDPRTRSNVQSTLMNVLRPLLSVPASRCFEGQNRPPFDVAQVAIKGGLCVLSVNATADPGLASLFFKLAKGDFVRAVQQRGGGNEQLCGVIADELPLVVTPEDVETLATVRSRRCFIAAATQGLAALDERIGNRRRDALLANFGSVLFLRSREAEVDHFAAVHLGTREVVQTVTLPVEEGPLLSLVPGKLRQQVPVCPVGTLGRLPPHQGFVVSPHGRRQEHPVWFAPWFEETPAPMPSLSDPATIARLYQLMLQHGLRECLDAASVETAFNANLKTPDRNQVLHKARAAFRSRAVIIPKGLETLPVAWLKALPDILWSLRQPHWTHLPFMVCETCVIDGMLQLKFAQEPLRAPDDVQVTVYDRVRIAVNAALYPSRWRKLKRQRHFLLTTRRPVIKPAGEPLDLS